MAQTDTNEETATRAAALALEALAWTLGEEDRAARFLALTGLGPDDLRERLDDPTLLAGLLKFLEAFEPDLIACAEALDRDPKTLVAARHELER